MADGQWYNGRYAYAIEAHLEYPTLSPPAYLSDITTDLGLPDSVSANRNIAWGDFNKDGWQDLMTDGRLYRNIDGARFEDVTERHGIRIAGVPTAQVFVDVDNDRDLDILLLHDHEPSGSVGRLLTNDGMGGFSSRRLSAQFPSRPQSIAIGDADNDGRLDLYVVGRASGNRDASSGRILLNDGAQDFRDGESVLKSQDSVVSAQWIDYDVDGDLDLSLSRMGAGHTAVLAQDDDGTFRLVTAGGLAPNVPYGHPAGPGDWGDADGDGQLNELVAIEYDPSLLKESISGERDMGLVPVPSASIRSGRYRHWRGGSTWADVDNDGRLDALITSTCDCSYATLLVQDPSGHFIDRSFEYGLFRVPAGSDAVWVDYDNDGKLDLATFSRGHFRLFRNTAHHAGRSLEIDLAGGPDPARAIGAKITLSGSGGTQTRYIGSGRGWLMQAPAVAHFGLDQANPDSVAIEWMGVESLRMAIAPDAPIHRVFAPQRSVEASNALSSEHSLLVAPNPFSDRLRFQYTLHSPTRVRIDLFSSDGRLVARHMDAVQPAGSHLSEWTPLDYDQRRVPPGTYIYRVDFDSRSITGRVILID